MSARDKRGGSGCSTLTGLALRCCCKRAANNVERSFDELMRGVLAHFVGFGADEFAGACTGRGSRRAVRAISRLPRGGSGRCGGRGHWQEENPSRRSTPGSLGTGPAGQLTSEGQSWRAPGGGGRGCLRSRWTRLAGRPAQQALTPGPLGPALDLSCAPSAAAFGAPQLPTVGLMLFC